MNLLWPNPAPLSVTRIYAEQEAILNWWISHTIDRKRGGFTGRIDGLGIVHTSANKIIKLTTDLILAYSKALEATGSELYHGAADRAFSYLKEHFWDPLHFGVFEVVDAQGEVVDERKYVSSQAACLHALATYARITKNADAAAFAKTCFISLEEQARDTSFGGYLAILGQDWKAIEEDDGSASVKLMQTHLEIVQAYTAMVSFDRNPVTEASLRHAIILFANKFIDPKTGHLRLRMDRHWQLLQQHINYGSDIKAGRLLHEAAQQLDDSSLADQVSSIFINIAHLTLEQGIDPRDGGLLWTFDGKNLNDEKHWSSQLEAVSGFLLAHQLSKEAKFLESAKACWKFIDEHLIDRQNGEWFWAVDRHAIPKEHLDKVNGEKTLYPAVNMFLNAALLLKELSNEA